MGAISRIEFRVEACVRGYHVYKDIWGAAVGEELDCTRERGNPRDAYTVAFVRNGRTGHLPRKLCRLCALCSGEGSLGSGSPLAGLK